MGLLHGVTCRPQRWEVERQQEEGQKAAGEDTDSTAGVGAPEHRWSDKQEVLGPQTGPEEALQVTLNNVAVCAAAAPSPRRQDQ